MKTQNNPLTAIILAAGFANRMRPLTDDLHKTLLPIGDRTIIERIIDGLLENGVGTIVVALGYRAEELSSFLNNRYGNECELVYVLNPRYRESNNIHTLALVFEQYKIQSDIILIESDLIYDPEVIERAISSPFQNLALVDRYGKGMDGTVVAIEGDIVTNVIPPHLQGEGFDFSDKYKTLNIYKFSQEFCERYFPKLLVFYSKEIDDNCYYELILGFLIYMRREKLHAVSVEGLKWSEVDDPNDLRLAEFRFVESKKLPLVQDSWGGYWSYPLLDFAFIRNMYFPTASIYGELRNNLSDLLQNYGSSQEILNEKLSYLLLEPADTLVVLNGASQVFPLFEEFFVGRSVHIPTPGFGEYTRAFPGALHYRDDGVSHSNNLAEIVASADSDVIVVINPNNPTGSLVDGAKLAKMISEFPEKFFIIDESFIDFSGEQSVADLLPDPVENCAILKSMSKNIGLPGIRLGYLQTHNKSLRNFVMSKLPIWNMNSVAEFVLEILLKHRKTYAESLTLTNRDRREFAEGLQSNRAVKKVYPSAANFLLVQLDCTRSELRAWVEGLLITENILVKDVSNKFDDGNSYIRLAVRFPAENQRLIVALNSLKNGNG